MIMIIIIIIIYIIYYYIFVIVVVIIIIIIIIVVIMCSIRWNELGDRGVTHLASALQENNTLESLRCVDYCVES